jgi:hypothetical protein
MSGGAKACLPSRAAAIAVEIATDRHKEERSSPAKPEPPAGPGVDS